MGVSVLTNADKVSALLAYPYQALWAEVVDG